jgi:predicted aspartyl protease
VANNDKTGWFEISFQQSIQDLFKDGPTTTFGIASNPYHGQPMLAAFGLIDTGAGATAISPRLVKELKLKASGSETVQEAGREPVTADFYSVRFFIPGMKFDLDVAGLPSLPPSYDILVGRDILGNGRLIVDFTTGITTLHFKLGSSGDAV